MSSCNYIKKTNENNLFCVSRYTGDDTICESWALMINTIDVHVCRIVTPLQTSSSLALRYKYVPLYIFYIKIIYTLITNLNLLI